MIVSDILIYWEGEIIYVWLQRHGPFDAVVDQTGRLDRKNQEPDWNPIF